MPEHGRHATHLLDVLQRSWPAAETLSCGPFTLRRSSGGGQRVTAASLNSADDTANETSIAQAEQQMRSWDQKALFSLLPEHDILDAQLAALGYEMRDPTVLMAGPLDRLLQVELPRLSVFEITPPLAIMRDLWAEGGIGADRLAVMARCAHPTTTLLARQDNAPAGVAYVAAVNGTAMVHALEVAKDHRRKGVAQRLMGQSAQWARKNGCTMMSLAVTQANHPAQALYRSLGMQPVGRYHYRVAH